MFDSKLLLFFFAGIALVSAIAWGIAASGSEPHLAGIECGRRHLSANVKNAVQAKELVASQEVICGRCHAKALKMSHPDGFAPNRKLPPEYPLDWKGDMTCSTCHLVHGNTPDMLRGNKRGAAFCLACHKPSFFENMKDKGDSLQQSAHLGSNLALGSQLKIDPMSLQCLGCHGNESDAIGVRVDRSGILHHSTGEANHPIGVMYPAYDPSGELRPRDELPKVILLPEGKVSCVSCHEVYKKQHGKLVMSNRGSSLCLQCHNL